MPFLESAASPDSNGRDTPSGLPQQPSELLSEPVGEHINVGRVIRVHGLDGHLRVKVLSDVPDRFQPGNVVYIDESPFTIVFFGIFRGDQILLAFQGVKNRNAAQRLVEKWITVPTEAVPALPEGEWFHFQLLGLRVITGEGEELGEITEILETGSNDVYVVSQEGTQILIPAIESVIREVRLDEGTMLVSLPNGLR